VTRRGYRRYNQAVDFTPRPAGHRYIRQFEFGGALDVQTDLGNDVLARSIDFTLLQVNMHSQDNFSISASRKYERLDEPFAITRDITLPLGASYNFTRYRLWGQTANRRVLAVSGFRWILTPGNDLYVVYTHNWLDEPLLDRLSTLDKRLASKILYTYRF